MDRSVQNTLCEGELSRTVLDVDIGKLKAWPNNARKHSKTQIKQLARSIEEFGFTNPVIIDEELTILGGHGRVSAAKSMGYKSIPCLQFSGLSQNRKAALVLALNKIAENAEWDEDLLSQELAALASLADEVDILSTGFFRC